MPQMLDHFKAIWGRERARRPPETLQVLGCALSHGQRRILTEFTMASNSMLMKYFSLFVFFYLSRKFAVFLRDWSLRRYCFVKSVRDDNIFSILLMRRVAACDWWRPRALDSSRLHSLKSLSSSG